MTSPCWKRTGACISREAKGPACTLFPVTGVIFDSPRQALTDADFTVVFPAVRRMAPQRLHLRGQHAISGDSIVLLNRLRSLRILDTSGTNVTLDGRNSGSRVSSNCISHRRGSPTKRPG